jgi:hypothetical protein
MQPDVEEQPSLPNVHRLLQLLAGALEAIGVSAPLVDLEGSVFLVHEALLGQAREFHSTAHVFNITRGAGAIETLAGLFHDVVYVNVDQGFPCVVGELLSPLLALVDGKRYRLTKAVLDHPATALVAHVFGCRPGDELSPFTGLNELASALVAARCLSPMVTLRHVVEIAAAIEATIPFRSGAAFDRLEARLRDAPGVALDAKDRAEIVRCAVRLANRDVANFSEPDPARFLGNTFDLILEANPALHVRTAYTNGQYRVALQKMEGFLSRLAPESVFHAVQGEPSPEVHAERVAQARRNITLTVRYLRGKLYTIAVVEALAEISGGDGPVEFFFGGLDGLTVQPNPPSSLRAETYLPAVKKVAGDIDPVLLRLFDEGRTNYSNIDLPDSPYTSFLYRSFGEAELLRRVEETRPWLQKKIGSRDYLASQASAPLAALVRAVAQVAVSRFDALEKLAGELDGAGCGA